jgi:hypothetical protein
LGSIKPDLSNLQSGLLISSLPPKVPALSSIALIALALALLLVGAARIKALARERSARALHEC